MKDCWLFVQKPFVCDTGRYASDIGWNNCNWLILERGYWITKFVVIGVYIACVYKSDVLNILLLDEQNHLSDERTAHRVVFLIIGTGN